MWTVIAFCWTTAKNIPVSSASAGTESTATISKTQSFPQTMHYTQKLCVQQAESNAKSAKHTSCQKRTISGTARTVPLSKSGRKPPSASAGSGWQILNQVSGCGSPVETSAQSAEAPTEAAAETVLTGVTVLSRCGYKQSARSDRAEI